MLLELQKFSGLGHIMGVPQWTGTGHTKNIERAKEHEGLCRRESEYMLCSAECLLVQIKGIACELRFCGRCLLQTTGSRRWSGWSFLQRFQIGLRPAVSGSDRIFNHPGICWKATQSAADFWSALRRTSKNYCSVCSLGRSGVLPDQLCTNKEDLFRYFSTNGSFDDAVIIRL